MIAVIFLDIHLVVNAYLVTIEIIIVYLVLFFV